MKTLELFEVLVRENGGMLTAYLRATSVPSSVVDDIWQETMLTAWRRWEDYDRSRPFGAWLRGIASKNVLAWYRRNAKDHIACDQSTLEYFSDQLSRVQNLPGDTFDEKLEALRGCIDALPVGYKESVRLRYQEDLKPAAMAEKLVRNVETVKKQLQRAKSLLFECIGRKLTACQG